MTSFSKAFQFKRNTFLIHFGKYLWHLSYFCRFMLYKLALSKCDKRNWKVNCRPCPPKDNIVGIWSQYFHFSSTSIYVHCPLLWVAIQEFIRQIYKQYSHICIHISLNWNSSIILYSWSSIMYLYHWICSLSWISITSYLLVLLRAPPAGADLPRFHYNHRFRDGRSSKTKCTLGDKGLFWNGSIMIYSKISVSCFVCSDKESCSYFNIVQKDSLSLILRVELFRF